MRKRMITRIYHQVEAEKRSPAHTPGGVEQKALQFLKLAGLLLSLGVLVVVLKGHHAAKVSLPSRAARTQPLAPPVVRPTTALRLEELGRHKALVFSPDIAAKGNREFYELLGFQYYESPSWEEVITGLRDYNRAHPENQIQELFAETHGCNGNGLKLQDSYDPAARRSYVSLGGLQERLEGTRVEQIILSACNTGRLFRPEIYKTLDLMVKDRTVLPATLGVLNASPDFDPTQSGVEFVRRADSRIELTSEGYYRELPALVRRELGLPANSKPFIVSNMFMQMMLGDPRLKLTNTGYVSELSGRTEDESTNEAIYQNFLRLLRRLAEKNAAPAIAYKAAGDRPSATNGQPRSAADHSGAEAESVAAQR